MTVMATLSASEALVSATSGAGWKDKLNDNFHYRFGFDEQTKLVDYDLAVTDCNKVTRVDPTSGAVTIGTPAAADCAGCAWLIEALNVSNTITIDPNGSETVNGSATKTIGTAGRLVLLRSDGSNWNAWYWDRL